MLPRIGITMGDAAGIGPEIIVKVLTNKNVYEMCQPVVIGSAAIIQHALRLYLQRVREIPPKSPPSNRRSKPPRRLEGLMCLM